MISSSDGRTDGERERERDGWQLVPMNAVNCRTSQTDRQTLTLSD